MDLAQRLQEINGAGTLQQLRMIREEVQERVSALLHEELRVVPVVEALNELHDALIRRVLTLAEQDTARMGLVAPPVPYAYFLFGSGGRGEQTLASDQDSGLVYGDCENSEDAELAASYFSALGSRIVASLFEIGYPPCEGNVIVSNPEWCLPISAWEEKVDRWFAEPSWEHVRYLLILADARLLAGDVELGRRWKGRYIGDMMSHADIARRMLENTLRHKVLIGVFGQLFVENYGENAGSLDIKYGAYIPMVNIFRLLAMRADIPATSTLGRIQSLREIGAISGETADEAAWAFEVFLRLRLLASDRDDSGQWAGSGKLRSALLEKEEKAPLKKALRISRRLQRHLEKEMQRRFGGR
ncbi:DUF294 nucleotidyltransferase-like domain-containing protein [Cohnella hashimotonis]|uniref:DUF294 nucleotidyltransferase-like domain-containing protein n=1 Tax=Cohnella hashimotonis TaxID=2826895 RepID=A0ABT6TDN2_9BACL|nr:DUF294 nucleotidyltransferase-like domain-containing protein [Cohnella hashimotonis]MDI4644929.1 DUF294 nucleotidyltransferase-like domain-containing protein [Cohnella hashimotonis]